MERRTGENSLESFWTPLTSHHKYILMFCFICDKIYWNLTEYTNCDSFHFGLSWLLSKVLYMSFDRFLLAVESRDLSQVDKSIIRVSTFSILQNFNFWMIKLTKTPTLPNCQVPKSFFWYNCKFYHSNIKK